MDTRDPEKRWEASTIVYKTAHSEFENHFDTKPNDKISFNIEPFKLEITGGFGGLHSVHSEPLVTESNSEFTVLEIDCPSYYPSLLTIISASKEFDDMAFYNICPSDPATMIDQFKTTRIKLEKESNPIHTIYKLIQNIIVGQTNANHSKLYCPRLNWSVTLNGQILLAELIFTLKPILKDLLWVNTDGFICTVKNTNITKLNGLIKDFGKEYGITIGNRDNLKFCAIATVKTVLRQNREGGVTLKGVPETFNNSSTCTYNVIKNLLKYHEYKELCDFTEEQFWQFIEREMEKQSPGDFVMHARVNNTLMRYYYAIKPDYRNGFSHESDDMQSTDESNGTKNKSRLPSFAKDKAISEVKSALNPDLLEKVCKFEYVKDVFNQLKKFGVINEAMAIPNNWAQDSVPPKQTRACVTLARFFAGRSSREETLCVKGYKGCKSIFQPSLTSILWDIEPTVEADGFGIITRGCIAGAHISKDNESGTLNKSYTFELNNKNKNFNLDTPCNNLLANNCRGDSDEQREEQAIQKYRDARQIARH